MAQATLNPGVGTFVADELAPVLIDTTGTPATDSVTGDWKKVDRPWECVIVLETATMAGTSLTVDVAIQACDNTTGPAGLVTIGEFVRLTENSDDLTKFLYARVTKPYLRAVATVGGSDESVPIKITVRDKDYHLNISNSA